MPAKTKAAMTKNARQRVLIAKDVIAQLKSGKLKATTGLYVLLHAKRFGASVFRPSDLGKKDVRDVLKERAKKCEVCAVGAIFIAQIMRYDDMPVTSDMIYHGYPEYTLNSTAGRKGDSRFATPFTERQLRNIEDAFERWSIYRESFPEPADRLIAIMRNVIRNNGNFVP